MWIVDLCVLMTAGRVKDINPGTLTPLDVHRGVVCLRTFPDLDFASRTHLNFGHALSDLIFYYSVSCHALQLQFFFHSALPVAMMFDNELDTGQTIDQ